MLRRSVVCLVACLLLVLTSAACGPTNRAVVHEEDHAKVFPWPGRKDRVTIRVKPRTTMNNACFLLGSFEEVEVNQGTTFYLVDELGKKFAYTPSRSPIRRLAPVESVEIRWPQKSRKPEGDPEVEGGEGETEPPKGKDGKGKAEKGKTDPGAGAPAGQKKPAGGGGEKPAGG